jgi:hypothetical protein
MNRNENETESFAGNFAASKKQRLFFEVPSSYSDSDQPLHPPRDPHGH